tara:strand:- start:245 stop:631 length:387 start_codon:yes stop_codon:yes gene_type:complete
MTSLSIKKNLKKFGVWCIQHWRWLVFASVALIAYLAGRKSAKNLWKQAELARNHYKQEAEAIEKAHNDKNKSIEKVENEHKSKIKDAEKKNAIAFSTLQEKEKLAVEELLANPEKIDESLKNIGIDEV